METINENLNNMVLKNIEEYKKQISHLNIEVYPIKVLFNLKSKIALGTIRFNRKSKDSFLIRLNQTLYRKYKDDYIDHVLKHEFAHACVMSAYKQKCKPHGKEWKKIMNELGELKPRASTNKFNLDKHGYIWKCKCDEFIFGKIKHNNAIKNKAHRSFYCRKCKRQLFFTGKYGSNSTFN